MPAGGCFVLSFWVSAAAVQQLQQGVLRNTALIAAKRRAYGMFL